ncbi:helix-turn-helix domain-containing protein [Neobacillus niacini]|uniref:helix-turn-helix domain-containing protein n=1 Tax=Neobacillus niacini TaxID=86668 RepID=UPI00398329B6
MKNEYIHVVHSSNADLTEQNNYVKQWTNKIKNFTILCIYNNKVIDIEESKGLLEKYGISITKLPIFDESSDSSSTFIVWDHAYFENEALFIKLRQGARNEVIGRIAKNIVMSLLAKYIADNNHSLLKDVKFIEQSIKHFAEILRNNTFFANNAVWENFSRWNKTHLTKWVLEEMEKSIGSNFMTRMDDKEFNNTFYKYLVNNLSENIEFLSRFTKIVNVYIQDWVKKIIAAYDIENCSKENIEKLLNIKKLPDELKSLPVRKDITYTLIEEENILVMNNAPYQSVRESIYKKSFQSYDFTPWPTAPAIKGNIDGMVQIKPYLAQNLSSENDIVQEAWDQAKNLSDLDVDLLDALCCIFLSKAQHYQDIVEIQVEDLLLIRGIKPKLGGDGRRGGFEPKQREVLLQSLTRLQSLWIDLDKAVIYEKGKQVQLQLQGRALIFNDQNMKEYCISEQPLGKRIMFTVGEVFRKYLHGSGRQVALLPVKALQYNPYRQTWEKRITRYLSWRWRIQARKGAYSQPIKVSTLMSAIGEQVNVRTPSRTRDRLEKALDMLFEDGVIEAWNYEKWDESIVLNKGWARIWTNLSIQITPPEFIKEKYSSIEGNQRVQRKLHTNPQGHSNKAGEMEDISKLVRETRKKLGLSLFQLAEEIEISSSYISSIERGLKLPSIKIQKKIMVWLQQYQDIQ